MGEGWGGGEVKEIKSGLVVALPRDGTGGECTPEEEAPTFEQGKEKKDHSSQRRENRMG